MQAKYRHFKRDFYRSLVEGEVQPCREEIFTSRGFLFRSGACCFIAGLNSSSYRQDPRKELLLKGLLPYTKYTLFLELSIA